ncbi:MAG: hypothetical protein WCI51_01230 [Lentisphaerota bacterium]
MKPYQALIWNEWRQMRGNVIALAGVTVLLWLLMLAVCVDNTFAGYVEMMALPLAVGLPLLYSIVLADSFAREFSQKTDSFLLELPASATKIFFCKYFANLAVFLALVILEIQLMRLIPGRHFDELHFEDGIMAAAIVVLIWILAHAMVFLTSLLGRKTGNGIVAIIILPLPVILLLPGTMAATMFFVYDETIWSAATVLLTLLVLYGSCIGLSWRLWSCRISRGLKIIKPAIMAFSLLLALPWALYGMAYCYTARQLNAAIGEAKQAGMTQDFAPPVPASPSSKAAIAAIDKLGKEYNKKFLNDAGIRLLEKYRWFNGISSDSAEYDKLAKTADAVLNAPEVSGLCNIMESIKKSADFRLPPSYRLNPAQIDLKVFYEQEWIILCCDRILSHKAMALAVKGDSRAFFECLDMFDIMFAASGENPIGQLGDIKRMQEDKFRIAAYYGPDTPEAAAHYRRYIKEIDGINLSRPDAILFWVEKVINSDFTPKIMFLCGTAYETAPNALLRWLYLPRLQQSLAAWLKLKIREKELFERARKSASYQAINAEETQLIKLAAKLPGPLRSAYNPGCDLGIFQYFIHKSNFEVFKIYFALKIYRARHGRFPDSLQQLAPEILPEIPINSYTGKSFGYQPDKNGFIFFRDSSDARTKAEYHPLKSWEKKK